jgi:hypothetical protein
VTLHNTFLFAWIQTPESSASAKVDITDLPLTMADLEDLQKSFSNVLCGQNAMEISRLDYLLSLLLTGRGDTGI